MSKKKAAGGRRWITFAVIAFLLAGGVFATANNGGASFETPALKTNVANLMGSDAAQPEVDLSGYKYDDMRDFMAKLPEGTILIKNKRNDKYHELDCESLKQMKGKMLRL